MKKKGFILLELLVSMSILMIVFVCGNSLNKFCDNLSVDIDNNEYTYEIQNLLSYGKAFCKEKNKCGKFKFNCLKNEIKFICKDDGIEKSIKLSDGIDLIKGVDVLVTPHGKIVNGQSIIIVDERKEKNYIVIRVGVDSMAIEDEREHEKRR